MDVERAPLIESLAGFAFVAGFGIGTGIEAVDRFGEDTGASRLADAARPAEQIGVGQLVAADRIFQRRSNMALSDDRSKGRRAVFPSRYDKVVHALFRFDYKYKKR